MALINCREKTVVVFGATGTVGAYACLHLIGAGHKIIAVGRRKSDNGFFAQYNIPYYSVDVCKVEDFKKLPIVGIDSIVNLSGMLPARMEGYRPQEYIDINMSGTLNILEYAKAMNIESFISTQSISDVAYLCGSKTPISADAESRFPLNNDHSVYSITKTASVNLVKHYSGVVGFKYYILRFPNIYLYHPNPMYYVDGVEKWQGYRKMIQMAIDGEPITIWGNPDRVRDIVYVKDCTQIIEKCIISGAKSGMYNVGTGVGTTMREQVEKIVKVFSSKDNISQIFYDATKPDTTEYIFDVSKTIKNLGYTPKYDYEGYLIDFKKEMERNRFELLWGEDRITKKIHKNGTNYI